jgi:hypothetical protein
MTTTYKSVSSMRCPFASPAALLYICGRQKAHAVTGEAEEN